jgi:AraC family transcriptional regulator
MNATSRTAVPVLAPGQFYGAVEARWTSPLVTLSVVRHARPMQVPRHSHQHMFLSLLLTGAYREWVDGREIRYQPLTVVFHPEHLDHRDEIERAGTSLFAVELHPALFSQGERRHRALKSVLDLTGGPLVWAVLRLYDGLGRTSHDAVEREEPVTELVDTLLGQPEVAAARPRWLGRVEEALRAEYREGVSLEALAGVAGVHPIHLARVFRRQHGVPIRTFVHRLRVLHACRLMAEGPVNLSEAALDSGFCDQSHMNRVFTSVVGMTPAAVRRAARGG